MIQFALTETQEAKLKEWQEAIKLVYGEYGLFEYRFTPNGIDDGVEVYSEKAKTTIDLTEVEIINL